MFKFIKRYSVQLFIYELSYLRIQSLYLSVTYLF
jgi:hypothetical protein